MKLMSLGINRMSIGNHLIICGKRGKNPSQAINSPFTAQLHHEGKFKGMFTLGNVTEGTWKPHFFDRPPGRSLGENRRTTCDKK
jgi:hypothetical protein